MQLFLDCDGVLADFDSGAAAVLGMDRHRFQEFFGRAAYLKRLAQTPDFYAKLELMPDAMVLFRAVEHLHPIILTGVPDGGWAEGQKVRWAEEHFPGTRIIATPSTEKPTFCTPGDVLVEDDPRLMAAWEAAGGVFVAHKNAMSTLAQLRSRFPEWFLTQV